MRKKKSGKKLARKHARQQELRAMRRESTELEEESRAAEAGVVPLPSDLPPTVTGTVASMFGIGCHLRLDQPPVTIRAAISQRIDGQDVVAGDCVEVTVSDGLAAVSSVAPRRTRLARLGARLDRLRGLEARVEEQVLAANVDVAVIVASTTMPPFRPRLVDRFIVVCQYGGIEPVICINKCDLAEPDEETMAMYRGIGMPIVKVSAVTGQGMDELRGHLRGKRAVVAGHSGVGKSMITNALLGAVVLETGEVGLESRGRHTTTFSTLHEWEPGSFLIDTPGIRALGVVDADPATLSSYFTEFDAHASRCRFTDCTHMHEPGCGVRVAAAQGRIPRARYESYRRMVRDG